MIKVILYIVMFMSAIWALGGLDLNRFFKQSKVLEARLIYLMLAISISYLTTNFLYDIFMHFQIIK